MSPSIGWDHHLRIDRAVRIGELIALFEVQKAVLPRNALQVERDAHAETRLRAVICVELHLSLSFGRGQSTRPAQIAGVRCPKKGRRYSSTTTRPNSMQLMTRLP